LIGGKGAEPEADVDAWGMMCRRRGWWVAGIGGTRKDSARRARQARARRRRMKGVVGACMVCF
jgi:hypothetical protein